MNEQEKQTKLLKDIHFNLNWITVAVLAIASLMLFNFGISMLSLLTGQL